MGATRRWLELETAADVLGAGIVSGLALAVALSARALVLAPAPEPAPITFAPAASGLAFPVAGLSPAALVPSFHAARGTQVHRAVDIPAPRGTAVVAVADGTVVRMSTTPRGGVAAYQREAGGGRCFYYAHLERYADGLRDGQAVRRGDVLGYVGSSGNAPPDAPHLHFAVLRLDAPGPCESGKPVDPATLLR